MFTFFWSNLIRKAKLLFFQLLVGQCHSLTFKNGVELDFQSICKQNGSLWWGNGAIFGSFFTFKNCNLGVMAHYRRGAQPIYDCFVTIFFVRKNKKKLILQQKKLLKKQLVCSQLCDKGKMSVLQQTLFPLTSCIHSLRPCGQNFQQHCYFTLISELSSKVHQLHYASILYPYYPVGN